MNQTGKWVTIAVLTTAGVFAFACGGGGGASSGATTPSASAPASATATASASVATAATAPANPPLVVTAMKLVLPKSAPIELKDDGSIVADGKTLAKFSGAELVDADGKTLVTVAADGNVDVIGGKHAKFDDKDALAIGGGTIHIGDDGVITLIAPGGAPDKMSGKAKFTGFKPTARRAATVLFAAMASRTVSVSPPAATAGPAATAPGKK
ncbi:MAG TPA: hypothetical protein VGH28_15555 [Polyangiaceae bacterium]|jgi:hypothetical protein